MATEQEAEDAHIVVLAADGRSPTEISRALFCSRTTVYAVVGRFVREERAAFDDRGRRGPKPLLEDAANEYIGRLVEKESPTEHGWLRSRWSCKLLALQLFRERAALVSRETVRRMLHRLGFRWKRGAVCWISRRTAPLHLFFLVRGYGEDLRGASPCGNTC